MNAIKNSVRLIGRLGADPEIKPLPSGDKMAKFSMATDRVYIDSKGETIRETHWHKIVVFGNRVKVVEDFLTKGKMVGIEGRLANRSYDGPDGTKRYITEIICQDLLVLGSPGNSVPNPFESEVEINQ